MQSSNLIKVFRAPTVFISIEMTEETENKKEMQLFHDSLTINVISSSIDGSPYGLGPQFAHAWTSSQRVCDIVGDVTTTMWIVEPAGEASTYRLLRPSHFHFVILFVVGEKKMT